MVSNFDNYGPLVPLVQNGYQELDVSDITSENYNAYFNGTLNIMRDGIEQPDVQALKIGVHLADGHFIKFILVDWWFNLVFWTFPVYINDPITIKYLFDTRDITKRSIKRYFDMLIKDHIIDVDFIKLNNMLDETMYKLKFIDIFAMYLANTVNFKDTLDLMELYPEFNASVHADLTGVPIENVKAVGMEYVQTQIKYIKNSEHCLRDSFAAKEAISPKQFKEVSVNIGTKPDGRGGAFTYIINNSFINGGVSTPESYVIESSVGRTAQILTKSNVGLSGAFARLLEINNMDTFFHVDPNYFCDTKNFIEVFIKDAAWLTMYDKRYYRVHPNGIDYLLDKDKDYHLIGKTLYFRSPITCASYARGRGICRKCYGNLYYINKDINPGKIATELLSSVYTQKLLSAKHLLEATIKALKWNQEFYDFFDVEINVLYLKEEIDVSNMYMVLDSNQFDSYDDDDDDENGGISLYDKEYTPSFDIVYPDGKTITFHTLDEDNMYLTEDLNILLRSNSGLKDDDDVYTIPLELLKTIPGIFSVDVQNQELQRTLNRSKHIIDRKKDTSQFTKDSIIQEFISVNMEGGLDVTAIHLEVIIANQMRDPDDILSMPDWSRSNAPYKILTLSTSLTNSPSITANLEHERIGQTLISPLSTKKKKPSVFDLFFMEKPQDFIVDKEMISDRFDPQEDHDSNNKKDAIYFVDKSDLSS